MFVCLYNLTSHLQRTIARCWKLPCGQLDTLNLKPTSISSLRGWSYIPQYVRVLRYAVNLEPIWIREKLITMEPSAEWHYIVARFECALSYIKHFGYITIETELPRSTSQPFRNYPTRSFALEQTLITLNLVLWLQIFCLSSLGI